jgi:hypothetical protein
MNMPDPRLLPICLVLAASAALAVPALAAPQAATDAAVAPPPQVVLLRVEVDATGKVRAARPLDEKTLPAVLAAAQEIAPKLQFTPASKEGRAVASETTLVLTLALERRPGGTFGISLRRAVNGPSVVEVGHARKLQVGRRDNGAFVVASVEQRADGSVDSATCKVEQIELRVPSTLDEKRFTSAACDTLDETRFLPDKVDGADVAARLSVPFEFNGGTAKPSRDRKPVARVSAVEEGKVPPIAAHSSVAGVVLPRVDYTAPAR